MITVDSSTLSNNETGYSGGAIYTAGIVNVSDSTISDNTATAHGGGINGGDFSVVTVTDSIFTGNTAVDYYGGAIASFGGNVHVTGSTISDNLAYLGGGFYLWHDLNNGPATASTIINSTISGNEADTSYGGGIFVNVNCVVEVSGSSILNNSAAIHGGGIYSEATVTITDSIIDGNTADNGGGIYGNTDSVLTVNNDSTLTNNTASNSGGGIYSKNIVNVNDSTISNNTAENGWSGGGISAGSNAEININHSTISYNVATGSGGGISGGTVSISNNSLIDHNTATVHGGGISVGASLTITDSSLTGNTAVENYGGAIVGFGGAVDISGSTISGNDAYLGGGLYLYHNPENGDAATSTITDSIISGNVANSQHGGGLYVTGNSDVDFFSTSILENLANSYGGGIFSHGNSTTTLTNSTVAGNLAIGYGGGVNSYGVSTIEAINTVFVGNTAVYGGAFYSHPDTQAVFTNVTIAGNIATNYGGGVYNRGALDIYNSIIAMNEAGTPYEDMCNSGPGSRVDNIIGGDPSFVRNPDPGNDDYGNLRLAKGSGAIDGCQSVAAIGATDLDGNQRVINGIADIGAYEYQGEIVVTTLDDDDSSLPGTNDPYNQYISLREALAIAKEWDENNPQLDIITFQDGLEGTITLNGSELVVNSNVTIEGPGAILLTIDADSDGDGVGESRVFSVGLGVEATFSGMTITGGYAEEVDLGDDTDDDGGGIYNAGTLTLDGMIISGNDADDVGGGIYATNNSTLFVFNNTTIADNSAFIGGGICGYSSSLVEISDSMISGNTASSGAGITCIESILSIVNSTISDNVANNAGGGIFISDCSLSTVNSTVLGNTARYNGGGIYVRIGGSVYLDATTITGNTASASNGGGISSVLGNASIEITDSNTGDSFVSNISNNSAGGSGGGIYSSEAGNFSISNTTVSHNTADSSGGGIYGSGADNFSISNSIISHNTSGGSGGGIRGSGADSFSISGSTISDNTAGDNGGGLSGGSSGAQPGTITNVVFANNTSSSDGGAIRIGGNSFSISDSQFINNHASSRGGAVYSYSCDLAVTDCEFVRNSGNLGGAIATYTYSTFNTSLEVARSIFYGNHASEGGVIYAWSNATAVDTVAIYNSTFSGNTASNDGGVIYLKTIDQTTLTNVTMVDNQAAHYGGGVYHSGGSLHVNNTILWNNQATNYTNIYGSLTSDHNLTGVDPGFISNPDDGDDGWGDTNDDYGNLRLAPGSEAIDATATTLAAGLDLDGNPRLVGTAVDIGAYEYQGEIIVTTLDDDDSSLPGTNDPYNQYISLREALAIAKEWDENNPQLDIITFHPDLFIDGGIPVSGTITLNGTQLVVDSDVIIEGPGAELLIIDADSDGDGTGESRVFYVYDGTADVTASFSDMAITGGNATNGGGIYNAETLTLTDMVISDNFADGSGGGIYGGIGSTITVANSSTISNNAAEFDGGGVYSNGTVIVDGSTISVNTAGYSGGGIYGNTGSTVTITNSSAISNNTAIFYGDGIFNVGTSTLIDSEVSDDITNDAALVFYNDDNFTYGGVISGSGSVTKVGSGVLILTGSNSYGGGTTINDGTLQLGDGTIDGSIVGDIDIDNDAALVFYNDDDFTYGGVISGSGSVTKNGNGVLILTGSNSYGGGTTINDGALQLGDGTIDGSIVGAIDIDYGSALVFANAFAQDYQYEISGGGKVTKIGSGILTLTGSNTYTGDTTIGGGTLSFTSGALGSDGDIIFAEDSTLQWYGSNTDNISSRLEIADGKVATLDVRNNDVIFGSSIYSSGSGSLTKLGSGKLTLTGVSTYTGVTTVDAGTLQLGNDGTNGSVSGDIVNNSALIFANATGLIYSYSISGSGTLTKTCAGRLTLAGNNT